MKIKIACVKPFTGPKQPFGDLFVLETRLNSEKSPTMKWKQIEISGNSPSPRWRHTLTLFDSYVTEDKSKVFKFLVFGGRGGTWLFFSEIN